MANALLDDTNVEIIQQQHQQLQITLPEAYATVQSLVAAGAIESDGTALRILTELDYDQYDALGVALGLMNRSCSWWVGDWLVYGEGVYGEKFADAAAHTGLAEQTLLNRVYVARHVPPERRRAALPFSVHAEVASLSAREQKTWLDKAEKHGWTRADLREAMRAKRREEKPLLHEGGEEDEASVLEVARAILRDAVPYDDERHHLVPNEDIARLKGALGVED